MIETVPEHDTVRTEIQKAVRHGFVYGAGNVAAKALGFLMLPFYTHYLNPVDYGILEILDLVISLIGMFLNMGMTAALIRSYTAAKTIEEKHQAVSTAFLFVVATGLITFSIVLGGVRQASVLLLGPGVPTKYLLISFASFTLAYIANLPRTYLLAREYSGIFTIIDTVSVLVMLSMNIFFIAVLKIGLLGILWSSFFVAAVQVVLLSIWILRDVGIRFSRSHLGQMVRFGLPLVFSNLALFALNFADRFFLQHLRSLEVVGIYAVGYKFGFMMNYILVQPFYIMWQSRMYSIHAQPDHPKIYRQIFLLYSALLTYAGLALSMLAPEIVHVMVDRKFYGSENVIPIVTLAYILYGVGYYAQLGMFLSNRTNLIGWVSAAAAGLNCVLNYFLILYFGMYGAAWATMLSFLAIAIGAYWCSQRVLHLPLGGGRVAITILVGMGLYFVSLWWIPKALGTALLMKALLLAAFPVVLWKTGILSREEKETIGHTKDIAVGRLSRLVGLAHSGVGSV